MMLKSLSKRLGHTVVMAMVLLPLTACGETPRTHASTEAAVEKEKRANGPSVGAKGDSPIQSTLDKAKANKLPVFVVVTESGNTDTRAAKKIADDASALVSPKPLVAVMQRDDKRNEELVHKWGLAGAPLPVILCISPKGNVTGGFTRANADAKRLAAAIPSPKYDDLYSSVTSRQAAFVIVGKSGDKSGVQKLRQLCAAVSKEMPGGVRVITVDANEKAEQKFIKDLSNGSAVGQTTVFVINAQGIPTGQFHTDATKLQLKNAATVVVSGSCCGGGGGC